MAYTLFMDHLKQELKKNEWEIKSLMKASFNVLHDSPAGRDDYESVTKSSKLPLLFCTVRWIDDVAVADRLIEVWPNIKQITSFWEKFPKSKQPSNKSYHTLKTAVLNELVIAKLGFFSYLEGMFEPLLTAYQTDHPMIPFLYGDWFKLLKNIFSIIIKPDMNKCETALKLKEIDLYSSANRLVAKEIYIGFVALTHIQDLRSRDEVSKTSVFAFKKSVRKCVVAIIKKLLEKSPIGSVIVRNACVFNPEFITSSNDESNLINKLKVLVSHLIKQNWIHPQYGDRVVLQYKSFLQNEVKLHHEKFNSYKEVKIVLMSFFSTFEVHKNFEELSSVIKIILMLSHGQSAVEHSFSLGKSFIGENISEECIRNKKLIKDHMLANNITPSTIQITKERQTDCKCACTNYEIHLEQEKKKNKIENNNQKSIISKEIN